MTSSTKSGLSVVLSAAAVMLALAGCGRKAPPLPPVVRVAEQTRDLEAVQEGMTASLKWTRPERTTTGGPLPDLEEIEVWRAQLPEAQEPQGAGTRGRQMRVQLLEARGEVLRVVSAAEVDGIDQGAPVVVRDDLEAWYEANADAMPLVLWYAVRSRCCQHRLSEFSNIVRLLPQLPPEPPASIELEPDVDGIGLQWPSIEAAVLVERSGDNASWQMLTEQPVAGNGYRDDTATQGQSWTYRLRAMQVPEGGTRVIGEPGPEASVDYPDIYPPAAPTELVCLPEGDVVKLRWAKVDEAVSYRVGRSLDEGAWERLSVVRGQLSFEDSSPPMGTLVYAVKALDDAKNQSEASTCSVVTGRSR